MFLRFISDNQEKNLCKLYFATETMKKNYSNYHDIVLIDATYLTNKYRIPLIIFSGIAPDGTNIVFGIAFVNDETLQTYNWVLKQFFESHNEKFPNVMVSGQDLSICSAVDKYQNHFSHFICQWHLIRNLKRNFAFLKPLDEELYDRVLKLPYLANIETFDESINKIIEFLQNQQKKTEYKNSIDYLNRLSNIKEKWADAFRKKIFTAGTHTTSRAESVNALFKRYMTRNCEISDIIYLLENIQRISCVQDFSSKNIVLKDTDEFIEFEPVLMDLRVLVSKQYSSSIFSNSRSLTNMLQNFWIKKARMPTLIMYTYRCRLRRPQKKSNN